MKKCTDKNAAKPEVFDNPLSDDMHRHLHDVCAELALSDDTFERLEFTARLLRDFETHGKSKLKSERQKIKDLEAVEVAAKNLAAAILELSNHQCLDLSQGFPPEKLSIQHHQQIDYPSGVTVTHSREAVECHIGYPFRGFRVGYICTEAQNLARAAHNLYQTDDTKQFSSGGRVKTGNHYAWHVGQILESVSWENCREKPIKLGRGGEFERLCEAVFIAAGVAINPEGAIRQFIEEKRAAENGLNDKPDLFADKTKQ